MLATLLAAAALVTAPPADAGFDYQIGGAYEPAADVGIVSRDRTEAPARGAYNVCYVNAFQTQPDAAGWWRREHPELILRKQGRPVVDGFWKETLLDTSTAAKRRSLARIVGGWIDGCARDGFDAVEPDNYDTWTRSKGTLTRADNVAFARLLVRRAHRAGLAIAQKNAAELAGQGREIGFDFAIAEECQRYDECDAYTGEYGDLVIEIEYPDSGGRANFERACAERGARISIQYRDRDVVPRGRGGYVSERC